MPARRLAGVPALLALLVAVLTLLATGQPALAAVRAPGAAEPVAGHRGTAAKPASQLASKPRPSGGGHTAPTCTTVEQRQIVYHLAYRRKKEILVKGVVQVPVRTCGTTVPHVVRPDVSSPPARGTWSLVFDDEFSGNAVRTGNWSPCYPWGCTTTDKAPMRAFVERETYDAANCSVSGGHLVLRATPVTGQTRPYDSCLLQTYGKETFRYGYFEARIWTPATPDSWPAFWLIAPPPRLGEIDIMESYQGNDVVTQNYHWGRGNAKGGNAVVLPGATAGWNTYAVDWEPGRLTWYIDGTPVWQLQGAKVSSTPMFLILDLAVDSFVPLPGVAAAMKVDYVRVWQRISVAGDTPVTPPPSTPSDPPPAGRSSHAAPDEVG